MQTFIFALYVTAACKNVLNYFMYSALVPAYNAEYAKRTCAAFPLIPSLDSLLTALYVTENSFILHFYFILKFSFSNTN
jgi:hypothetical protein